MGLSRSSSSVGLNISAHQNTRNIHHEKGIMNGRTRANGGKLMEQPRKKGMRPSPPLVLTRVVSNKRPICFPSSCSVPALKLIDIPPSTPLLRRVGRSPRGCASCLQTLPPHSIIIKQIGGIQDSQSPHHLEPNPNDPREDLRTGARGLGDGSLPSNSNVVIWPGGGRGRYVSSGWRGFGYVVGGAGAEHEHEHVGLEPLRGGLGGELIRDGTLHSNGPNLNFKLYSLGRLIQN